MNSPWQARHPFAVGATVYARAAHELGSFGLFLKPGEGYVVRLRGEDAYGLWVAVEGVVECLPVRLFTKPRFIVAPPATMISVSKDGEAA